MDFVSGAAPRAERLALVPAAWNPPTRAHLALAEAARVWAPEVALVLARRLPHKQYEGPSFETRLGWLLRLAEPRGLHVAISSGGLFVEMARAGRAATAAERVFVVCGRDAAERIVHWDYGAGEPFARQLEDFEMLVAARAGAYQPPPALAPRIHPLKVAGDWDEISSSNVRAGLWRDVPDEILAEVRAAYS